MDLKQRKHIHIKKILIILLIWACVNTSCIFCPFPEIMNVNTFTNVHNRSQNDFQVANDGCFVKGDSIDGIYYMYSIGLFAKKKIKDKCHAFINFLSEKESIIKKECIIIERCGKPVEFKLGTGAISEPKINRRQLHIVKGENELCLRFPVDRSIQDTIYIYIKEDSTEQKKTLVKINPPILK